MTMDAPKPERPPEQSTRDRRCRQVLSVCTALFVLALLTTMLWPVPPPASVATQLLLPALEPPPPPSPTAPIAAEPEPSVPTRLPDGPEGEPSLLVVHGDRSCPRVALTFDAGSGADGAAAILDVLNSHGIISTFFLTGKWVERYPDLARRIADEGHEIANHTYSHPDLTMLAPEEVLAQVKEGEEAIFRITGKESRPLFREPYGAFNEEQRRLVRQAGFSYSIYWDVDTLDWQFPPLQTLVARITEKSQNGSVVLMHLNVPDTARAVDQAIPVLQEQGFDLVTVSDLLACQ